MTVEFRALSAAALLSGLLAAPAHAAVPVVEETLSPAEINVGESAQLRIKSSESNAASLALPVVPGLEFRIVEELHGVEFVHGVTLATTTLVVRVTPQFFGTFTIPGGMPKSQPLLLRVNPMNLGGPSPEPGGVAESKLANVRMAEDDSAFVRLTAERREVFVGENVPIAIELGARGGGVSSLNGPPTLSGRDFILDLSQPPDRKETVIDGKPFLLLTWHSVLAPVKPGDYSLSIQIPLTIRVSTRPRGEAKLEDQLGDPFMQRVYGTTVSKKITAQSAPLDLNVSPLPSEGRPAEFTGAVGTFKISSEVSPAAAAVGDPLTLRMRVTGTGSFDRIDSAMLEHLEHWKTYPPTSSFKSGGALGVEGEKVLEQPVIALTPGAQTLPGLAFAYFDPSSRQYVIARTAPLDVQISPSAANRSASGTESPRAAAGMAPHLRPDHAASSTFVKSLLPPYLQPRFLAIPFMLALLVAGVRLEIRRRAGPVDRQRQSPASRRKFAQLQLAARSEDRLRFFELARDILQETLAERWRLTAEAITPAELGARLDPGPERDELCRLLSLAYEASYAGRLPENSQLEHWLQVVRSQMKPLLLAVFVLCLGTGRVHADSAPDRWSADTLYNLGNTEARSGRPGMAILDYRRAALLAPGDPDIEANLRSVESAAGLGADTSRIPEIIRNLSPTTAAWLGLAGWVLIGGTLLGRGMAGAHRPGYRWASGLLAAGGGALIAILSIHAVAMWPRVHDAVAIVASAPVRIAPAPMGDALFALKEGQDVRIFGEHEGFLLVRSLEGKMGWVWHDDIARVVP